MQRSASIAIVTSLAFVWAVLWPDVARAADAAPPAAAQPAADDPALAAAKQHFEAGKTAYNAGDFINSIREFKAAEALRPSPILAYNIGLANEKLGRRRVAVRYYRRYLEGAPAAANRAEVEGRIATLEREIAAQPQAQPQEQPQDNPPPPPSQTQPQPGQPGAQQGAVQANTDPYAPQPVMTTAPKKRNLWWVWLLVGIGCAAVVSAIVVAVIYGYQSSEVVYYNTPIDPTRLRAADRGLLDRNAAVPTSQRGAETLPLLQLRF